jgi:hypothetical protein
MIQENKNPNPAMAGQIAKLESRRQNSEFLGSFGLLTSDSCILLSDLGF